MLTADQIQPTFPDLTDEDLESALALVHQRFSTNTFPSWPLAHPYRYVAHNGEINTLRGNINWMKAREGLLRSPLFGDDLRKLLPIIREGGSDTATFDNVLEFLVMAGRSLPHAVLMMIPEPWSGHEEMSPELRAFYEYHSALMEPWDGPASIAFTDGTVIGAVLDRNGLRPSRYYVTKDGMVVMASEVGVLDIPAEDILIKERLHPGRIFLVDTALGRIVSDEEIKRELATAHPYERWLAENLVDIDSLPEAPYLPRHSHESVRRRQHMFGYTQEDLRLLLAPMATDGQEPVGSMGTDTTLAVLSERPRLLYDYFKQVFAQVTNPPLDAIREELVTTMASTVGPEGNLLDPQPESCRQIQITYPVIDNDQLAKLRHVYEPGFRSTTLPMLFDSRQGGAGLERAMEELQKRASDAVEAGYTILILSDRSADRARAPIPSLLATAARPSSSRPPGHPDAMRPRRRVRRRPRSASLRAAPRLWRRSRQPVPGLRVARRHDRPRPADRRFAPPGRAELHPRAQQGHPQVDVQDGHLDAPELLRRANLRGGRARSSVRRPPFRRTPRHESAASAST